MRFYNKIILKCNKKILKLGNLKWCTLNAHESYILRPICHMFRNKLLYQTEFRFWIYMCRECERVSQGSMGPGSNLIHHFLWTWPHGEGQVTKRHEPAARVKASSLVLIWHNTMCLHCSRSTRPTTWVFICPSYNAWIHVLTPFLKSLCKFRILRCVMSCENASSWCVKTTISTFTVQCNRVIKSVCVSLEELLTVWALFRQRRIVCFVL